VTAVALVGVTASGKSALAMSLARQRDDIEIVSVDSMCVYRGMDIGTAKPSAADQAAVPHHLLDLVDPDQEFAVTDFQAAAREVLAGIAQRDHHALLVGGTGLYLRAVVDDLRIPGRFPEVRAELEAHLASGAVSVASLHERLAALDPRGASRMELNNQRRIVRALEVTIGSGQPFSSFGPGLDAYPANGVTQIGLAVDPEVVDQRIAARIDAWVEAGFVDEVRALADRPQGISRTARQALGYREVLGHVEDDRDLKACLAETALRTRQFTRRQASWFRRDPRIAWAGDGAAAREFIGRALDAQTSRERLSPDR
jgi:tRNA dimethylallyltransferase